MSESKTIINNTRCITCVSCFICGDAIELSAFENEMVYRGHHIDPKVCDKCKAVILAVRSQMEVEE